MVLGCEFAGQIDGLTPAILEDDLVEPSRHDRLEMTFDSVTSGPCGLGSPKAGEHEWYAIGLMFECLNHIAVRVPEGRTAWPGRQIEIGAINRG